MKRIVLLILVLTAVYGLAQGQSLMYGQQKSSSQPMVGLCGGLNVCSVTGTTEVEMTGFEGNFYPMLGINGGIMLYLPLPTSDAMLKNFILQGELKLNTKGAIYSYSSYMTDAWGNYLGEADVDLTHIYGYAEVPMLVKYNLKLMGVGLQPYLGASLGYLLFAEESWIVTDYNGDEESDSESIRKYLNDVELTALIGCDLMLGKNLMMGARYSHALTEVYSDDNVIWKGATNQCISFNAGIMFDIF